MLEGYHPHLAQPLQSYPQRTGHPLLIGGKWCVHQVIRMLTLLAILLADTRNERSTAWIPRQWQEKIAWTAIDPQL